LIHFYKRIMRYRLRSSAATKRFSQNKPCDQTAQNTDVQATVSSANIFSLPHEIIIMIIEVVDVESSLSFLRTCHWFYNMLNNSETFWRNLCLKSEFFSHSCLEQLPQQRIGFSGQPMYLEKSEECGGTWSNCWRRGVKMRTNVVNSNFQGWRLYSNSSCPVAELSPNMDINKTKQALGEFPRLAHNDDLKIDWDENHLVLFHFFRGEFESCTIRIWDIEDEPKFLYEIDKGTECVTDKVSVHSGYVVIVPSWPLEAGALVMTLDINNKMEEKGKYLFPDEPAKTALDQLWEHTQLRVVKCKALVTCRTPDWRVVMTSLPDCVPLVEISLTVSNLYECQQIRSYKGTAVILFAKKSKEEDKVKLVTIDVGDEDAKVRSTYSTDAVTDVALYTDPEEIYLVRKDGHVFMYDATKTVEKVKITNPLVRSKDKSVVDSCDYQLFVNGKEQICVVQSAPEASVGRNIKVYSYHGILMYEINLDLLVYGLSRDESVCIYTNAAFLAVADSKRFVLFNVKNGKFIGIIYIPCHLERTKGKEEKDCMFEQTGLGLFVFDENRLIAVHDYERSFPAVLDIYKFW